MYCRGLVHDNNGPASTIMLSAQTHAKTHTHTHTHIDKNTSFKNVSLCDLPPDPLIAQQYIRDIAVSPTYIPVFIIRSTAIYPWPAASPTYIPVIIIGRSTSIFFTCCNTYLYTCVLYKEEHCSISFACCNPYLYTCVHYKEEHCSISFTCCKPYLYTCVHYKE